MSSRDRIVLMAVIVVAVLGAGWMLVVSPERKKASSVSAEVTSAQATLSTAESELSKAHAAQTQYAAAYSSIVSLGKAVPAEKEVPSLIFQLSRATEQRDVFFSSISTGGGAGASGPASSTPAEATAVAAGFTTMPFSFIFDGSFFDLERLMRKLTNFTTRTASGALKVNGRLLTIQSVNLAPVNKSGTAPSSELTGTVTASAYVLPGGTPADATPASPTGASTPASTPGAPSSPTAPATVTVNP